MTAKMNPQDDRVDQAFGIFADLKSLEVTRLTRSAHARS
jgi:hypothetical protein